jgi:hypothetical protein
LVTAVRAARKVALGPSASAIVGHCSELPADTTDRPLVADVAIAQALLGGLATMFDAG